MSLHIFACVCHVKESCFGCMYDSVIISAGVGM